MDENGDREKYRTLINNLWYIYGNYAGAINNTSKITSESSDGIKVNGATYEEGTVSNAVNDLNASKGAIYNLIMSMREKG
jgi:hypothetical protein